VQLQLNRSWKKQKGDLVNNDYVHGYSSKESRRLEDQANCLSQLLHHDSLFPAGSLILEAGCGTGAQTRILAPQNPECRFISIDISDESLQKADSLIRSLNITNVEFQKGDIFNLQFQEDSFDHVVVCFVLEHLSFPVNALLALKKVLKTGGTITVIEGDHGSAYFHPYSRDAQEAINAQVRIQSLAGGDACIGRQLYPLLVRSNFTNCRVSPRMVYVDSSKPEFVEGFTKNTFTAMIEGIRDKVIERAVMDITQFDKGVQDLYRTAATDGVFCYTFFKGIGLKS
jgi:ubiquinone/menaquinone biosynthesis C-methylase UbiE